MIEHWMVWLDNTLAAPPRWWGDRKWQDLTDSDLAAAPGVVDDFTRYSPCDGSFDESFVPPDMPREVPHCSTRLSACHDAEFVYVFITAVAPSQPIAELADCPEEEFGFTFDLDGVARGLYFGLNQKGEHRGSVHFWNVKLQPVDACETYPWSLIRERPGKGLCDQAAGMLQDEYSARIIAGQGQTTAAVRIVKRLFQGGFDGNKIAFSAGRFCRATGEGVAWGSPIFWTPRTDQMGRLALVERLGPPPLPTLHRVDMRYDPEAETARFDAQWQGPVDVPRLAAFRQAHQLGENMGRYTVVLNDLERTREIAARTSDEFELGDGWNRLQYVCGFAGPRTFAIEKYSGQRIVVLRAREKLPTMEEVRSAFANYHEERNNLYRGNGNWGSDMLYTGAFNIEPYALVCLHTDPAEIYQERVRETCERLLAAQHPDGWFPLVDNGAGNEASRFSGGAYTHGSVSEALLLGSLALKEPRYLDAARRAAEAYKWYRYERNQNFMAFALWHLALLQEISPSAAWLDKALYYAQNFVTRDIGPCGAQGGHNCYTIYGGHVTLKGMAGLLRVLPGDHAFYPVLKDRIIRMTNQILSRQQPSGLMAARDRNNFGLALAVPGLFAAARAVPELGNDIEPALAAMYRSAESRRDNERTWHVLSIACMGRYLAERRQ